MTHYHIDTDMGVDDALALYTANRVFGPAFKTVSTVFGNVPVKTATRNAKILRALLPGADFAVLAGADRASDGERGNADHVHGKDGLGGAAASLNRRFLDKVAAMPVGTLADVVPGRGRVTIIAIGPATNLPRLIAHYGRARIARIVVMSGVFFDIGNVSPYAEFNAHCDPAALRAVVRAGVPVTFVPLDVTRKVVLSRAAVKSYLTHSRSRVVRLLVAAHGHYMDHYRDWEGIEGCFPHDSIAVLAAWQPERFTRLKGRVTVTIGGKAHGRTSFVPDRSSPIEVVTGGDLKWVRQFLASP